jgi:membrane-associated phospholipid phosphatase
MSSRNVDAMHLSRATQAWMKAGFSTIAVAEGWARVEGGVHFPTDVLVGEALGNFVARLFHDAFLGGDQRINVTLVTNRRERMILIRFRPQ